jgi:2-oxoglutarate dehydrogenase E1 component
MTTQQAFHGPNEGYIYELYEKYLQSPDSVDEKTRRLFQYWQPNGSMDGTAVSEAVALGVDYRKILGLASYVQAIRQFGHLAANLDPLGQPSPGDPELDPEAHGITEADLRDLPADLIDSPVAEDSRNALEAVQKLREIYTSSLGFDNEHVRVPEERQWLRNVIESRRYRYAGAKEQATALLDRLTQVETFELFLQQSFPTKYRFSIEGLDMMVPMLDEIIQHVIGTETSTLAIGMAHRGRLNILAHIMKKPYSKILADFKDPLKLQEMRQAIGWTVGDVKYHKGVQREVDDDNLVITMPPNPSHLEQINPVAVGMARAAGTDVSQPGAPIFDPNKTIQILIHGDASFPGQGIVAETFNLSRLPGYWTGGTIHIIANNQLGFTTLPEDGRSTLYASDLAKGFRVAVIHVNADDPAACIEAARIAYAYQETFEKDILIDLIGYRRYGHNELDEPSFTQPLLYEIIRAHPTVRQQWAQRLIDKGLVTEDEVENMISNHRSDLEASLEALENAPEDLAEPEPQQPPAGAARTLETAVSAEHLRAINAGLAGTLDDMVFYSRRLESTIRKRREALDELDEPTIDWATAEELAFATILEDGIAIRMSGQDTERGTFSHRHAVLHHAETGEILVPLQSFPQAHAAFEIHNSPLSEAAVVGFEYGYNVQEPGRLVVWEAQYGDFVNGAQVIIDEFVVSAREKWGHSPSLVLLLPHGHEGAGPDHSSGRPERFLQSAAKTNLRLANVTTAAQYFHLLRRQALLLETDPLPLIIMTPKSLLRNPQVSSTMRDLTEGRFHPVYDDVEVDPKQVTRLVFCSGKFYLDLINSEYRSENPHVALIRMEQLYPFPLADLREVLSRYPSVSQIVWAQEEPKNMGAWEFMGYRLKKLVGTGIPVNYVGRRRSSSPAEGSSTAHSVNQSMITEYAFNWQFGQ